MFATDNPTNKYVLAVDGFFGYVTKDQADATFDSIEHIDDSAFGSIEIIPPGYQCEYIDARENYDVVSVVDYQPIDIINYTEKKADRMAKNFQLRTIAETERRTCAEKIKIMRAYNSGIGSLFGFALTLEDVAHNRFMPY